MRTPLRDRRPLRSLCLAVGLALAPRPCLANTEATELWTDLGLRLVPLRRLQVTFTNSTRFSTTYGLRRVVPELTVDYHVWRPLRVGAGYRYLWRRDGQGGLDEGHLVYGDVMAQFEVSHLDIELRSRVQYRNVQAFDHGLLVPDERSMWRNRVNLEWHFPGPFSANASFEQWTRLDGAVRHDRFRVGAGASVEVARWRFQAFVQRDIPTEVDEPNVTMVGLSARMTLDFARNRGGSP